MCMKKVLGLAFMLLMTVNGFSQNGETTEHRFYDLYLLLNQGKYEKCVKKAERLVKKDKNQREPLPYLYMSMAYSKMFESVDYRIENPKLLKNAAMVAARYRKKDKHNLFLEQNKDFFEDLRVKVKSEAKEEFLNKKFSKASSWYKKVVKFFPEDYGAWTLLAVSQYYAKDKGSGDESMASMEEALDRRYRMFDLPDADKDFKEGMELYSQYLIEIGQSDSARSASIWVQEALAKSDERKRDFIQGRF